MRWVMSVLGLLAAMPVSAAWTFVTSTDGTAHYVDAKTLRKTGDLRRIWELSSSQQPNKGGVASQRLLVEYDCREKRYRLLQLVAFSAPMAGGTVVGTVDAPAETSA